VLDVEKAEKFFEVYVSEADVAASASALVRDEVCKVVVKLRGALLKRAGKLVNLPPQL
jgi:hypothetical protein